MSNNTFQDNLKNLRISKKVNQKELAKILNTSVKTISHWETGYSEPSISQLIQLAHFFDITIDELVGNQ